MMKKINSKLAVLAMSSFVLLALLAGSVFEVSAQRRPRRPRARVAKRDKLDEKNAQMTVRQFIYGKLNPKMLKLGSLAGAGADWTFTIQSFDPSFAEGDHVGITFRLIQGESRTKSGNAYFQRSQNGKWYLTEVQGEGFGPPDETSNLNMEVKDYPQWRHSP